MYDVCLHYLSKKVAFIQLLICALSWLITKVTFYVARSTFYL